jgi:hypothetical protein
MRVGIDKAGQHDAAAGVDYFAIWINERFYFAAPAHRFNPIVADEHRTVLDDRKLTQITAGARPVGARKRNEL